jgi:branched-chain amino acid aminotransferase
MLGGDLRHKKRGNAWKASINLGKDDKKILARKLDNFAPAFFLRKMKIFLDGKLVDESEAKISVFDHGLLYGDGVFEGIRLYEGNIFRLDQHLERLEYSAKALMLQLPLSRAAFRDAVADTCRANGLRDAYIRLVVTRGVGDLGLAPWSCSKPSVFIIAGKISIYPREHYEQGLAIVTVPTRRIGPAALPPTVKSLNYLNNILGKIEARQFGALEAIMLNEQGYVAECTADNVFIVQQGTIVTPAASHGALKGITRATIFDIGRDLGVPVQEANLTRYDVWCADECFLTGTGAEVIPVVKLDGREIGDGKPGPITAQVLAAFRQRARTEGVRL